MPGSHGTPDSSAAAGAVFAHSRPDPDYATWEPLSEHLDRVAELAAHFAGAFGSAEWGRVAGLWHDLGKYRPEFQARIRGANVQAPHASTGAALAAERRLDPIAFVIAGHHAGLANKTASTDGSPLPLRQVVDDGRVILASIRATVPTERLTAPALAPPAHLRALAGRDGAAPFAFELWVRMLFSALVDADRLATEAFYEPDRRDLLGDFDALPALRGRLDKHLDRFHAETPVDVLRAGVLANCREAADEVPGFFSLTVPTGGGKTLSAMAFALRHAERHGLRRVIVVVPFTSIIEQNAAVYRDAVGPRQVIEHHSGIDEAARRAESTELEVRRQLAVENWDAPVVVTTAVQLFESLLGNAPSRCRKLHNVVGSVIVLDEAQTLPTQFLAAVLDVLRELVRGYGCSVVLSTATQPALRLRDGFLMGIDGVREITRDVPGLAAALRRVTVRWPAPGEVTPYIEVAEALTAERQVLTVVHRRPDARALAELLPRDGLFHLSTRMCAAHRSTTIGRVRAALDAGAVCRVVSTQLIEAGVDLSFPVVFRAMAGLDSIAQAAGRCNRNGALTDVHGNPVLGRVEVFRAETRPPRGVLSVGLDVAEAMLAACGGALDFTNPTTLDEYFRRLYHDVPLDPLGVMPRREALDFAEVARLVRLVDDGGQHPVVVPWCDAPARLSAFARSPGRETARALQPFVVQVRSYDLRTLQALGAVEVVDGFGFALLPTYKHLYGDRFGLTVDGDAVANPEALCV